MVKKHPLSRHPRDNNIMYDGWTQQLYFVEKSNKCDDSTRITVTTSTTTITITTTSTVISIRYF